MSDVGRITQLTDKPVLEEVRWPTVPTESEDPDRITSALKTWMTWCRDEQKLTALGLRFSSYPPDTSKEYRQGRVDALREEEARLGLLMLEQGIDLRPEKKPPLTDKTPARIERWWKPEDLLPDESGYYLVKIARSTLQRRLFYDSGSGAWYKENSISGEQVPVRDIFMWAMETDVPTEIPEADEKFDDKLNFVPPPRPLYPLPTFSHTPCEHCGEELVCRNKDGALVYCWNCGDTRVTDVPPSIPEADGL